MPIKIFAVFDSKVGAYLQPFFLPSTGAAVRAFTDHINDPKSNIGNHPADYSLFELGSFDELTGTLTSLSERRNLGTALEYKSKIQNQES